MAWYDVFASFYDASVQAHYTQHRLLSAEALNLGEGMSVLDLPCGTGQSFEALRAGIGESGHLIGVDLSRGMLRRAGARVERGAPSGQTTLRMHDARVLSLAELPGGAAVDRLHVFLGMSVFEDMPATFENLWGLLRPGGRCVIVDVHSPQLSFQGRMVNLVAGADIRRRFWEPLAAVADDFERTDLPYDSAHGGQIMLAAGNKPG